MAITSRADALDAYRALTRGSQEAWERASRRIPGGVSSNVRFYAPYPLFMERAAGARLYDVDGREYLDYCLAFGPLVAGHGHPRLTDAIRAELSRAGTVIFGAPSPLELTLAERLARLLPSAEMVRFTNSGTEATLHALRLARGVTGRTRIVKFEGHYHGGHDAVLMGLDAATAAGPANDGIPPAVQDATVLLPFNDAAALRRELAPADNIAAVIVEPVARGVIAAEPAFLRELRDITSRRGMLLIFDEVVSWPRVGLGGAQTALGITPDLTTLGKAIGGGLPMGAIAGRRAFMEAFAPRGARAASGHPYVFHGGTYNGTPMALAAGLALLDLLEEPGVYAGLHQAGERMREGLRDLCRSRGIAAQVSGIGAVFDVHFADAPIRTVRDVWQSDLARREQLDYRLFELGIYNSPLHRFHLSLAHGEAEQEQTLAAFAHAL